MFFHFALGHDSCGNRYIRCDQRMGDGGSDQASACPPQVQILEILETYSKIIVKITFRLCQLKLSPTLEYLKCNYIIKYSIICYNAFK